MCNAKGGLTIDISVLSAKDKECVGDCVRLHELVHVMDLRRANSNICKGVDVT